MEMTLGKIEESSSGVGGFQEIENRQTQSCLFPGSAEVTQMGTSRVTGGVES